MLFIFAYPGIYLVGLFLTIVSVASLGSSFVLLNSFLPLLVANHLSIRGRAEFDAVPLNDLTSDSENEDDLDEEDPLQESSTTNALLNGRSSPISTLASPTLKLSNHISSKGIGIGYAASVLVQLISISIIYIYSKVQTTGQKGPLSMPLRIVLFLVGLWWAAFTIPTAFWLRHRPGPPLPWDTSTIS